MSLIWQQKFYNFSIIPQDQLFSGNITVYNTANTFTNLTIISGSLPGGLFLTTTVNNNTTVGTISGQPTSVTNEIASNFVIRADDSNSNIADCTVELTIFGALPPIPHLGLNGTGNLGVFPDGTYTNISIAATSSNPNANLTYTILSPLIGQTNGILPPGLALNSTTGAITGYPNPEILIPPSSQFGFDQTPFDGDSTFQPGFDFGGVISNVSFPFSVAISDGNLVNVASYSMVIERLDFYNGTNSGGNINIPYYHPPALLNTEFANTQPYINLGTVATGSQYYHQFQTIDFDGGENGSIRLDAEPSVNVYTQTAQYLYTPPTNGGNISTVNTTLSPIVVLPANISLNSTTGWLSGFLQPTSSSLQNYNFNIRVSELGSESWTNTFTVDYATYLPFTALNYADQLTMDAAVLDYPNTNFDGKTILFVQQTNFANVYHPGNTAPPVFSNIALNSGNPANSTMTNFGWYSYYNSTSNVTGPAVNVDYANTTTNQSLMIWQFTKNSANSTINPRFDSGNISATAFYTLSIANVESNPTIVTQHARIIPNKLVTINSNANLINNTVQFLYPLINNAGNIVLGNTVTANPYQSIVPVTLSITDYKDINISWQTNSNLNTLLAGEISNLRINASINNWTESIGVGASAAVLMKLQSAIVTNAGSNYQPADILTVAGGTSAIPAQIQVGNVSTGGTLISAMVNSPGVNYGIGDILTVSGGSYANAATIQVLSIINNGQIHDYTINFGGIKYSQIPNIFANQVSGGRGSGATFNLIFSPIGQILDYTILLSSSGYSKLPQVENNPVTGGAGIGAAFNLFFSVGSVNMITSGQMYDGATVGFEEVGESIQAQATALFNNKTISAIDVNVPGSGYTIIPAVLIEATSSTHSQNIINYQLVSGTLPQGLTLQSNGLLVGRAAQQTQGTTSTFVVRATAAMNTSNLIYEQISSDTMAPFHIQDSIQTIFNDQQFTITIATNSNTPPISNMYLDFILSTADTAALFAPINDQVIVPAENVYRSDDQYFGIPQDVKMLMAYGLNQLDDTVSTTETTLASIVEQYHYIKNYYFTSINWAQSLDQNGNVNYEVIYLTPSDIYTANGQSFSGNLTSHQVANPVVVQPATLPNMIMLLQTLGTFNPAYLPSWMTSTQPNGLELGWVPAVPIVYLNPGTGLKILNRLKNYYAQPQNSLNRFCATSDRYIWESDNIYKYIVFPQQTNYINFGVVNA